MVIVNGKVTLIPVVALLSLILSITGIGIVVYNTTISNVDYTVTLDSIDTNGVNIWGSVTLDVKNRNDFSVSFTNINISLAASLDEPAFYVVLHAGGNILAGQTYTTSIDFNVVYDDIPESEITAIVSGLLIWKGDRKNIEYAFVLPLEFEI